MKDDNELQALVGSHFMMGFKGTSVTPHVRQLIEQYRVGTILLASQNLSSAEQTVELVRDLQQTAYDAGHDQPLLIAIDQENGGVNAIFDKAYIRQFPSALGMVATNSAEMARAVGSATAKELSCLGVNWLIGPVLDVLANPRTQPLGVRSMGDDPLTVAQFGVEFIKGYHEGGIATCGKHFPSYGNLEFLGTPSEIPIVPETVEQLRLSGLVPFEHAIQAGVDSMLVGACSMPNFAGTPMTHACLAKPVVNDLLRQEMRFEGVIVSDCLEIEALYENLGVGQAVIMGHTAGCDVLLICSSLASQSEAISALFMGIAHGMISKANLETSGARIRRLKAQYTSWEKALNPLGIKGLQSLQSQNQELSRRTYERSISLVRDQASWLPLRRSGVGGDLILLTPLVDPFPTGHGTVPKTLRYLKGEDTFRELGLTMATSWPGKVRHASYTASGIRPLHEDLISDGSVVVLLTADCGRNAYQYGFTKYIMSLCKACVSPETPNGKPLIVVAVSSPYDFARDAQIGTYLCTYDFTTCAFECLVNILFGRLEPKGVVAGLKPRPQPLPPKHKPVKPHQNWLVEEFSLERDMHAFQQLLERVHNSSKGDSTSSSAWMRQVYQNADTLLMTNTELVECHHFVVRNSSTKVLYGFCAIYVIKPLLRGSIGCVVVDPERRKLGIGQSLHFRSMRCFLQHQGLKELQYGADIPAVMPGVAIALTSARTRLSRWIKENGYGYHRDQRTDIFEIPSLDDWILPSCQYDTSYATTCKCSVLLGRQDADSAEVLDFISKVPSRSANALRTRDILFALYKWALLDPSTTEIIMMRDIRTNQLIGLGILYRLGSMIAKYFPLSSEQIAAISSIILRPEEHSTVLMGLILAFAVSKIKDLGFSVAQIRNTDGNPSRGVLQDLGFKVVGEFESFICDWKT